LENIQEALEEELGDCGVCPETPAPTPIPTPAPTPAPTEETPAPTEETPAPTEEPQNECDDYVFKCGTSLYICGDLDPEDLCNHGSFVIEPITDEECDALIDEVTDDGDACDAKCPNGNSVSNYGLYGCAGESGAEKCDCDGRNCESCATSFSQSYASGCASTIPCGDNAFTPSYTMCGRDGAGGDSVEFCAWPEAIQFVLEEFPMSTCGICAA
jgi:hypothetical protein